MSLSFVELFHKRSLQILATEVCKSKHQISPAIMQKRFKASDSKFNSRKHTLFANTPIRTQISSLPPKIEIKKSTSLKMFPSRIKYWKTSNWP